jgi:AbrB family looped-hinge helix DNA binding protein
MELAKITARGQLTLPIGIRKRLCVREGSKVVFLEENGRIIIENAGMLALLEAQTAMRGEAEKLGLNDEQDVVDMIREVRRERREERLNAGNG